MKSMKQALTNRRKKWKEDRKYAMDVADGKLKSAQQLEFYRDAAEAFRSVGGRGSAKRKMGRGIAKRRNCQKPKPKVPTLKDDDEVLGISLEFSSDEADEVSDLDDETQESDVIDIAPSSPVSVKRKRKKVGE